MNAMPIHGEADKVLSGTYHRPLGELPTTAVCWPACIALILAQPVMRTRTNTRRKTRCETKTKTKSDTRTMKRSEMETGTKTGRVRTRTRTRR